VDIAETHERQLRPSKPSLADALLALGLTAIVWLQLALPRFAISGELPREFGPRPPHFFAFRHFAPSPWTYVLVAACFLPLVFRRRYPLIVLGAATAAAALYRLLPLPPTLTWLAPLIALYTVGTLYSRVQLAVAAIATAAITLVVSLPPFGTSFWISELVRVTALLATAALLGDATRNWRAYLVEAERRAREAEHTREEEARRRVDDERLRIARELHDITAHSLSVIAVQSGMAEHVIDNDPEQARRALGTIRQISRSALGELRSVIGVLREADEKPEAPLAPAPSLLRLDELKRPLVDAGLAVNVELAGEVASLPSMVDASAYRIVQEALTNAMRHAGATRVDVGIRIAGDAVHVEVTDDGRGASEEPEALEARGHGITGMRERALALGGELEAGPGLEGGFTVSARLPLNGADTAQAEKSREGSS